MPTVTGNLRQLAGSNLTSGQIVFTAPDGIVQDRDGNTTRVGPHTVAVGASGIFSESLPATGAGYYVARITATIGRNLVHDLPTLLLQVPEAGADLSEAVPAQSAAGDLIVQQTATVGELGAAVDAAVAPMLEDVAEAKDAAVQARTFAYRAEETVRQYDPRIKGIEAMAGLTPGDPVDGQTSNLLSNRDSLTWDAAEALASEVIAGHATVTGLRTDVDELRTDLTTTDEALTQEATDRATEDGKLSARLRVFEQRTPEDFGAVAGDSVDSTAAIRAWLQAGCTTLPPLAYRITGDLSIVQHGLKLVGHGATFLVDGNDSPQSRVLSITGDNVEVTGLRILGLPGKKVRGGIYVIGDNAKVYDNDIADLVSEIESRAIHVEGRGGHKVTDNRISNISATGNVVEGDGTGMARAVVVYTTSDATMPSLVTGNIITDILGEEGDAITVLASDGVAPRFESGKVTVKGNTLDNCSRRFIKVQGSDVEVKSNTLRDSKRGSGGNAASAVNVYASGRVTVKGNEVWYSDLGSSINVQGAQTGTRAEEVSISDNDVYADTGASSTGIYVDHTNRVFATNNRVHGGLRGIGFGNVSTGAISNNVTSRLQNVAGAYAAAATNSCTRIAMTNNTDVSGVKLNTPFINDSVDGITENNRQLLV